MKHSVVFIMIFLSCVFLSAQEALQHLSPKQTSEIQKKVSGFKCPEGANRVFSGVGGKRGLSNLDVLLAANHSAESGLGASHLCCF
jgi:hypothetical protein